MNSGGGRGGGGRSQGGEKKGMEGEKDQVNSSRVTSSSYRSQGGRFLWTGRERAGVGQWKGERQREHGFNRGTITHES